MPDLTSSLPPAEYINDQQSITISNISLGGFPCRQLLTRFGVTNTDSGTSEPLTVNVYRIDNERTRGYIPSKTWWTSEDDDIHLLYYTSPTLPPAARPFGDSPCYAFTRSIQMNESIDYPIDTKVLVDQILISGHMHYLFLFAEDQMKHVLATDWIGNPWPIDVPEIELYRSDIS
jgi:hypothetical protein